MHRCLLLSALILASAALLLSLERAGAQEQMSSDAKPAPKPASTTPEQGFYDELKKLSQETYTTSQAAGQALDHAEWLCGQLPGVRSLALYYTTQLIAPAYVDLLLKDTDPAPLQRLQRMTAGAAEFIRLLSQTNGALLIPGSANRESVVKQMTPHEIRAARFDAARIRYLVGVTVLRDHGRSAWGSEEIQSALDEVGTCIEEELPVETAGSDEVLAWVRFYLMKTVEGVGLMDSSEIGQARVPQFRAILEIAERIWSRERVAPELYDYAQTPPVVTPLRFGGRMLVGALYVRGTAMLRTQRAEAPEDERDALLDSACDCFGRAEFAAVSRRDKISVDLAAADQLVKEEAREEKKCLWRVTKRAAMLLPADNPERGDLSRFFETVLYYAPSGARAAYEQDLKAFAPDLVEALGSETATEQGGRP